MCAAEPRVRYILILNAPLVWSIKVYLGAFYVLLSLLVSPQEGRGHVLYGGVCPAIQNCRRRHLRQRRRMGEAGLCVQPRRPLAKIPGDVGVVRAYGCSGTETERPAADRQTMLQMCGGISYLGRADQKPQYYAPLLFYTMIKSEKAVKRSMVTIHDQSRPLQ